MVRLAIIVVIVAVISIGAPILAGIIHHQSKTLPLARPAPYAFEFCQSKQEIWPGCKESQP